MLKIYQANLGNVALLFSLIQEMAKYEKLPFAMTIDLLERDGFGVYPRFRCLIAEFDNEAAGYALFFDSYSSFQGRSMFLEDLFVRPRFRKNKIGQALLSKVASMPEEEHRFGGDVARPRLEHNCDRFLYEDECYVSR